MGNSAFKPPPTSASAFTNVHTPENIRLLRQLVTELQGLRSDIAGLRTDLYREQVNKYWERLNA